MRRMRRKRKKEEEEGTDGGGDGENKSGIFFPSTSHIVVTGTAFLPTCSGAVNVKIFYGEFLSSPTVHLSPLSSLLPQLMSHEF